MTNTRSSFKNISNNVENTNKNICILEICKALGVEKNVKYLHTGNDVIRAIRTKHICRSRNSLFGVKKGLTMSQLKKAITIKGDALAYYVCVKGHGLLLNKAGLIVVDTDPRKADRRKVLNVMAVYKS